MTDELDRWLHDQNRLNLLGTEPLVWVYLMDENGNGFHANVPERFLDVVAVWQVPGDKCPVVAVEYRLKGTDVVVKRAVHVCGEVLRVVPGAEVRASGGFLNQPADPDPTKPFTVTSGV